MNPLLENSLCIYDVTFSNIIFNRIKIYRTSIKKLAYDYECQIEVTIWSCYLANI